MPLPGNNSLIRVALVEDDVHFQNALIQAIGTVSDMALLAVAGTRALGLQMLDQIVADVLLVDLGLPDGSGIDVIRAAQAKWPACNIMVSTAFGDEAHVTRSLEAGATGYLLKDSAPHNMLNEIRSLHGGGSPISPLIARQILMRFRLADRTASVPAERRSHDLNVALSASQERRSGKQITALSAREQEVLEFTTKGYTSGEIAELLYVSHHTVLTYVRRIYKKLEVNSKTEAINAARDQGLLPK